ncbi:MAG TPA: DNA repair protein RecO [Kiritimatiellia bacterium]|nr:DNA repair protein RecO [Kiritimatiellia bacterium]HRZ13110.1 DNA repair protein RecO [Kiritimatiellia bacterium]HSA17531.1 DNA repair protein RecO [Kiritimatiellia bacterium]
MILKTTALALRLYPFSNTSRIVSWLTPDQGRIVTMIKGSQRARSLFLGQYDLFYTCELLYHRRERGGLHIARECSPLKWRAGLRHDWKAAATASYLAGLVAQAVPPEAPHESLFRLLDSALDHLEAAGAGEPFVFWFELRLLEALGLSPRLRNCAACGAELASSSRRSDFAAARGGLLCAGCVDKTSSGPRVGGDVLGMLAGWQQARLPQGPLNTKCSARQIQAIEALLSGFLEYHLDVRPVGRREALDVLARRVA